MDEEPQRPVRVVVLSESALYDLSGIDNATAATWGEVQAERYLAFLQETFAQLLDDPSLGHPVEDRAGIMVHVAKINRRRTASGHRIFYRVTENGIRIIRILHTAMNWPDRLS